MEFENNVIYILKRGAVYSHLALDERNELNLTNYDELLLFDRKEIVNSLFYRVHFRNYGPHGIYPEKYFLVCNDEKLYKSIFETELVNRVGFSSKKEIACYLDTNLKFILSKATKEYIILHDHYYEVSGQQQKELGMLRKLLREELLRSSFEMGEMDAYNKDVKEFIKENE